MGKNRLSDTEQVTLMAFYSAGQKGTLQKPKTKELALEFGIHPSAISRAKRNLKDRKFLYAADDVTQAGAQALQHQIDVVPSEFPLISAKLQAGKRRSDELVVNMLEHSELAGFDGPFVTVPSSSDPARTVAFEVHGASMEDHNIFNGDYVLVELFPDGGWPQESELIVTRYLPPADNELVESSNQDGIDGLSDELLEGPTLKFYYERDGMYRLSVAIDSENHPSTIRTLAIRPAGRVVGVYRNLKGE